MFSVWTCEACSCNILNESEILVGGYVSRENKKYMPTGNHYSSVYMHEPMQQQVFCPLRPAPTNVHWNFVHDILSIFTFPLRP